MNDPVNGPELIGQLNDGNTAALGEVFRLWYPALSYFARSIVQDDDAARDLVQDVFISYWEGEYTFGDLAALRAFLYTSVRNRALNDIEKRTNRKRLLESMPPGETEENELFRMEVEADVLRRISDAVDLLPAQSRDVFTLSYLDPHDISEVSEILGIAENTVRVQRQRAKKMLRERLKDIYAKIRLLL